MTDNLATLIPKLANRRILVLGDVILDEYITGRAERLSREAPIPVLEFTSRRYIPGGAANPASNIVALRSTAIQVGIIGDDETADHLKSELQQRGIDISALVTVANKPTTLKTRILAQMGHRFPQQVARIDTLSRTPIPQSTEEAIISIVKSHIKRVDAVLVSDYHNGLLTQTVVEQVKIIAQGAGVALFVDAQGNLEKYRGYDVVKCNADDARQVLRREIVNSAQFDTAANDLFSSLSLRKAMIITRGGDGATIANGGVEHIPAPHISDVFDTVGAGDTWIAILTLAHVAGASLAEAALLANIASGIVVRHVGNYTPSPHELAKALK
ncbi:MAG: bifunctional ADP-heptose synthase [Anaerolineae bacterium]|nr:bifunctional ADP-heptose synthase [Anaerolineae bacterium]MDQ7034443.1 bifunctional ADP-heptose synthase [Anaerolineae bacterium]